MPKVTLPYKASRSWMERQILSGEPLSGRRQSLVIDLDELEPRLHRRVEAIADAIALDELPLVVVLDSGIDPTATLGDGDPGEPMNKRIEDAIGSLPEVDEPTTDVVRVVAAWESWLERYQAEALAWFSEWQDDPPVDLSGPQVDGDGELQQVTLSAGHGILCGIPLAAGPKAVRDALAAGLRERYLKRIFDSESVSAAREATLPPRAEIVKQTAEAGPDDIAADVLRRARKQYQIARAHHLARAERAPDFESEMRRWAVEHGSRRLQIGLEDGYRMTARYLAERIAREAPGFYAMPVASAQTEWCSRAASPSEAALVLRRKVAAAMDRDAPPTRNAPTVVRVVRVLQPPHEIYVAGKNGYPVSGWAWHGSTKFTLGWAEPYPFEAVVVFNWLGRYHLVGAVRDSTGEAPSGIWAAPDPDAFGDDGLVRADNPDTVQINRARKKPPSSPPDDDIPF